VVEQRGLADAGLADERQRCALARPRTLEHTLDVIAFTLAPYQHGAILAPGPAGRKD
jgi:hypothetical protein